jgi:hypothetical protein
MPVQFARGKFAFGFCDRCGFRFDLGELKKEIVAGVMTQVKVCPECWDPDHPQLMLGKVQVNDPQALYEPRPDNGQIASTSYFGWNPVGGLSLEATVSLGTVTERVGADR